MSMAKPASQFSVFSALAMPGKSGISVRSAVGPSIGARANAKSVLLFLQPMRRAGNVISQPQFVARLRLQIIRQPLVDHNFVVAHVRRDQRRAGGRDHRVGRRFLPVAQFVDEIGQNQFGRGARPPPRSPDR